LIVSWSEPGRWARTEHLALLFLDRKVQSEIPRFALQKLDALLVSIEQLGSRLSDPSSPRN
jgi:hypothetical protein